MKISAAAAKSLQSCPTLWDPIDGSPPGSSIPAILQARTLEWVAISFSNACMHAKLLPSCPSLCNPMDSSAPGSSVHRILQARIQEWVAISYKLIILLNTTSEKMVREWLTWRKPLFSWKRRCKRKKKKSSPQQQKGTSSGAHNLNVCLCCHSGISTSQRTGDIVIKA